MKSSRVIKLFVFLIIFVLVSADNVEAYIGPGAGFAFVSSFLVLFITILLSLLTIAFMPLRLIIRAFRRKRPTNATKGNDIKSVVIVGLDGMDPCLANKYMNEGKLPNLSRLATSGTFKELNTTLPAMSPVAWSSFITGVDPSRHNIFDFLNRDLMTYIPELSSTKIVKSPKSISIGKYSKPIGKPRIKLLRKGRPFWSILGEYGIFSQIIRVPMTFPPEKLYGTLLSAMCVPDLKGTQGTFSYYTSNGNTGGEHTGGIQIPVNIQGDKIKTYVSGPENYILKSGGEMRIPLEVTLNGDDDVCLKVPKESFTLKRGVYSKWVRLTFRPGLNMKVHGICRFFIKQIHPDFEMYMTPINIDPERPLMPISHPLSYSIYLSKLLGSYATLGLAEDTWALNERVIEEDTFLEQVYKNHTEREDMLFNAMDKMNKGLCVCVFDATDRIQHMFMRFISRDHPADRCSLDREKYKGVIEDLYKRMDDLIGRVVEKMDDKDVLMVISDHGFKPFKRGVNLNTWLYKNGYLALKDKKKAGGEKWFRDLDWERTKAYTFGLTGIYINEKGREAKGVVTPGEKEELKEELIKKLSGLKDDDNGDVAIRSVYNTTECYDGPYLENGPDIIIGYNEGYRASWGAAVGSVDEKVFEDNKKSWSGDHCMDPQLVPGVLFCNKKISRDAPHILDIGPTVVDLFGVEVPEYMQGRPLIAMKRTEGEDQGDE